MQKMSDLLKLHNIVQKGGKVKAFPLVSNLIELKIKSNSEGVFGQVALAVDDATIKKMQDGEAMGVLYVFSRKEWDKERNE